MLLFMGLLNQFNCFFLLVSELHQQNVPGGGFFPLWRDYWLVTLHPPDFTRCMRREGGRKELVGSQGHCSYWGLKQMLIWRQGWLGRGGSKGETYCIQLESGALQLCSVFITTRFHPPPSYCSTDLCSLSAEMWFQQVSEFSLRCYREKLSSQPTVFITVEKN